MFINKAVRVKIEISFDDICKIYSLEEISRVVSKETLDFISQTKYLVEATSNEKMHLYPEYKDRGFPSSYEGSVCLHIASIADEPVWISLTFQRINNRIVCFCEMTGNYACGYVCNKSLGKIFPNVPKVDAMNFHNVMLEVIRTKK